MASLILAASRKGHDRKCGESERAGTPAVGPATAEGLDWIIAGADGTMIRLVQTASQGVDDVTGDWHGRRRVWLPQWLKDNSRPITKRPLEMLKTPVGVGLTQCIAPDGPLRVAST